MADSDDPKADFLAEKAYAAAAETIGAVDSAKPESPEVPDAKVEDVAEPVEFPAKPKRARKEPSAEVAPPVDAIAPATPKAHPAIAKPVKPKIKRVASKPVAAPPVKARKPAVKKIKPVAPAIPKPVKVAAAAAPKSPFVSKLKDIPMDMSASIKDAFSGAQDKAKEAFTKGSAFAGEYGEFAKGNVEAVVESGKILASGLKDIGDKFVAESKTAFETATADVKAMTGVKSPTDFLQLQSDILRRNFETAISFTSKTGEALIKLTSDAAAPISGRVNLAVEKVKKAA